MRIAFEALEAPDTLDNADSWASAVRDLIELGDTALPSVLNEFEATSDPVKMRKLAFVLRGIGDPRAIPTLIRNIPKTLQPAGASMGPPIHWLAACYSIRGTN